MAYGDYDPTSEKRTSIPIRAGFSSGYSILNGTQIRDERDLVVAVTLGDVPELDPEGFAALIITAVNAYDKQRALIETLTAALTALSLDVRDYPAWQRPCHALDLADAALAAAKEQSA